MKRRGVAQPRGFVLEVVLAAMAVFFGITICAQGCFASDAQRRIHDLFAPAAVSTQPQQESAVPWWRVPGEWVMHMIGVALNAPLPGPLGPSAVQTILQTESASSSSSTEQSTSFSPFVSGSPAAQLLHAVAPVTNTVLSLTPHRAELPVKIVIAEAGVSSSVSNPTTTDMSVLEADLLSGAVRYPTTSLLGENGTMLIFGHSSYLPKIHNPAYRTFDGVQNLAPGTIVHVYSATTDYQYAVRNVVVMDAADASANSIPLPSDKQYLVIDTCDTFASKSDRFVLTADLVKAVGL